MTQSGIEPQSPGLLANTLPTKPMMKDYENVDPALPLTILLAPCENLTHLQSLQKLDAIRSPGQYHVEYQKKTNFHLYNQQNNIDLQTII